MKKVVAALLTCGIFAQSAVLTLNLKNKNTMASLASKLITPITPVRTRAKKATSVMEELAAQFHEQNVAANAAKRAADKAREALYVAMMAAGIESLQTMAASDKGTALIEAKIKATTRRVIDVEALQSLVGPETFLKIVSATQKSVVEHCGTDLAMRCSKEETGDENVSVTVVK